MFYVEVHALAPATVNDAGGAYVSCWVNADNETDAEVTALQAIEGEGWTPEGVTGSSMGCQPTCRAIACRSLL
ncbi:hypothetical protein I41_37570 [Lacipirellula limnantheis]|uniref:Uncharacterized protein n=1 Tax=Lacipirellula limnantheis TaxID=2528024 RepID=A0A517U1R8_9BACT|nr:hypothetical protein I41_37570 [Lacipirellula limnantheis]